MKMNPQQGKKIKPPPNPEQIGDEDEPTVALSFDSGRRH